MTDTTTLPATTVRPFPTDPAPRRACVTVLLATLFAVVLAGCGLAGGSDGSSDPGIEEPTFEYVIPEGSGDLIAQGEPLDILPREIVANVGETIAIHNEDTIAHSLGPWFVGPGEVLRQRFLTVGVYEGACSVHPSGAFTVTVQEA